MFVGIGNTRMIATEHEVRDVFDGAVDFVRGTINKWSESGRRLVQPYRICNEQLQSSEPDVTGAALESLARHE